MKLSQAGLARRLNWPQTTVSRVEQGQRSVTLPELLAVARAYRCSAAELLVELSGTGAQAPHAQVPPVQPFFSPGFSVAYSSEAAALAQLARYGVRFLGAETQPSLATLPLEEVVLAALRFSGDPRVFEALPALVLKSAKRFDWSKLLSGAYAFHLQNRLGMVVAAALQLRPYATDVENDAWAALQAAHNALAGKKLDQEEVVGPRPKTAEALASLRGRTPVWLSFWHGLGSADIQSFQRWLTR
jgi:transcriptional regulator with XRE-family HTH domain